MANYVIENKEQFVVQGPTLITSNDKEMTNPTIGDFWQSFYENQLSDEIKNKQNEHLVYGVYHSYESDLDGEYSLTIGCEIDKNSIEKVQKFDVITIPKATYAVFDAGNIENVLNTWRVIWKTELKRSYCYDFEVYDNITNLVKIYIGLVGR